MYIARAPYFMDSHASTLLRARDGGGCGPRARGVGSRRPGATADEECAQYGFCAEFLPFVSNGQAVMAVEYRGSRRRVCEALDAFRFNGLRKRLSLKVFRKSCR